MTAAAAAGFPPGSTDKAPSRNRRQPPFPLAKPCGRQLAPTLVKDRFKGRVQKSRPRSASRNCVIGGDNAGNADRDMR